MQENTLIIGGTKGIGKAIYDRLNTHERYVISRGISDMNNHYCLDVLQDELPEIEGLNNLVYCPGSINLKPFHRLTSEDFISDYRVNVLGAVRVLQFYFRELKKNKGSVVLFGTVASQQGMSFHASIAAAKGGLESLARSLAAEWAPHIRVNIVNPSLTDTPLAEVLLSSDQKRENAALRHPLKKIGSSEDIAKAAIFCLENEWLTGQSIGVDGGMSTVRV